jgi:hypothetical protein
LLGRHDDHRLLILAHLFVRCAKPFKLSDGPKPPLGVSYSWSGGFTEGCIAVICHLIASRQFILQPEKC